MPFLGFPQQFLKHVRWEHLISGQWASQIVFTRKSCCDRQEAILATYSGQELFHLNCFSGALILSCLTTLSPSFQDCMLSSLCAASQLCSLSLSPLNETISSETSSFYSLLGAEYSHLVLFGVCTESWAIRSLITVMATVCTLLSRTFYIKNQPVTSIYFVYCSFILFLSLLCSSELARNTVGSSCFLNYPVLYRENYIFITNCCILSLGTLFQKVSICLCYSDNNSYL